MSLDALRSIASPILNFVSQAAQSSGALPGNNAATGRASPQQGLQVADGFDAEPQVTRAASVGNTTAAQGADAADPTQQAGDALATGQDAMANNPIMKFVQLFTDFIKNVMSAFFGGGDAAGQEGAGAEGGQAGGLGQGTGAAQGADAAAGAASANGQVNVRFKASLEINGQEVASTDSADANASASASAGANASASASAAASAAAASSAANASTGSEGGGGGDSGGGGGGGDGGGGAGGGGGDDPLTIDTSGRGIRTMKRRVNFDLDADGKKDSLAEVRGGMLAIRGGKDGRDLIGNHTDFDGDGKADGFADGFDALEHLAKKEGLVNERRGDTTLDSKDLRVLERKYGLGIKEGYGGEKKSLASAGVRSIELSKAKREEHRL
ncbi:MAG: hypothetical protein MUC96_34505, partial [Myxococcaceae bacterium]|nr:hypothetical protein [Myxococcaceae bacterium]